MVVGGLQGGDVGTTQFAGALQIRASPRKAISTETHDEEIRHQSGMTSIAVRKGVNLHEPVMETYRDFVGRIGSVFDPFLRVAE